MIDKKNIKWVLIGLIALFLFSMKGNILHKETVADVEGKPCVKDSDCPCWGKYNQSQFGISYSSQAWGIGTSDCIECSGDNLNSSACKARTTSSLKVCDITYCFDVQPVGKFLEEHPWEWMKENQMIIFVIIGLLILVMFWPEY